MMTAGPVRPGRRPGRRLRWPGVLAVVLLSLILLAGALAAVYSAASWIADAFDGMMLEDDQSLAHCRSSVS